MAKNKPEQPLTLSKSDLRPDLKLSTGSKSIVSNETYVDPNEAHWERHFQKLANEEKERLRKLEAS